MGIFNFFKKPEKKPEIPEKPRIAANEILQWFNNEFSGQVAAIEKQSKAMHNGLIENLQDLRDYIKTLKYVKFKGDEKTSSVANMVKDSFVKKMYSAVQNVPKNFSSDYGFLNEFHSNMSNTIKNLNPSPKQTFIFSKYFSKEWIIIGNSIRNTQKNLGSLKNFLDSDAKILEARKRIEDGLQEHERLMEQLNNLKKKEKMLEEKARNSENLLEKKKSRLGEIRKDSTWNQLDKLNNDIEDLDKTISLIKEKITQDMSSIKRPLKKFIHLKDERGAEDFIYNPFDSVMNNEALLKDIIKRILNSGLKLKPKEKEKLDDFSKKADSEIPELKKKYKETLKLREARIKELSGFAAIKERDLLEDEIEKINKDIEETKEELAGVKTDKEKPLSKLSDQKKLFEKIVSESLNREIICH